MYTCTYICIYMYVYKGIREWDLTHWARPMSGTDDDRPRGDSLPPPPIPGMPARPGLGARIESRRSEPPNLYFSPSSSGSGCDGSTCESGQICTADSGYQLRDSPYLHFSPSSPGSPIVKMGPPGKVDASAKVEKLTNLYGRFRMST